MSLLSFRSVCINVLLNSGIGAEFFMTCTFGIGMLYSDINLFTYVQIVVYFLNAAFQFYTSKVIRPVRRGSCAYFGGARSWSATGLAKQIWFLNENLTAKDVNYEIRIDILKKNIKMILKQILSTKTRAKLQSLYSKQR